MSEITRICAGCGEAAPLEARYCPHCGYDTTGGPPAPTSNLSLPMALGKAALPVVAGVASLAARFAWKLIQQRLNQPAPIQPSTATAASSPAPRTARRVIRIRSSWAVGDANGVWRKGTSDQTIEIDD
jgi:hypothetical protein